MNAIEAREIAIVAEKSAVQFLIKKIEQDIEAAAKTGLFGIYHEGWLPTEIKEYFESKGFKILRRDYMNIQAYYISW